MTAATVQPDKMRWRGKPCLQAANDPTSCLRAAGLRCRLRIAFPRLRRRWKKRAPGAGIWPRRTTRISTWPRGFCPKALRPHFHSIYAYCRVSDDLGDEVGSTAPALALLDLWGRELDACYEGRARHPVFVALARDDSRLLDSQGAVCGSADGVSPGPDGDALRNRWRGAGVLPLLGESGGAAGALCVRRGERREVSGCRTRPARRCNWPTSGRMCAWTGARIACICRRTTCGGLA